MANSTRITIETESLLTFHCQTSSRSWCPQCAGEVEMIALEATAPFSIPLAHELQRWLNSGGSTGRKRPMEPN